MNKITIDGMNADKTTFIPLADDDRVWLHRTTDAQDLVDLVTDPFKWVGKIFVTPAPGAEPRPARLLNNFVISIDVATSVEENTDERAVYVIDGIDMTGFISVKMATFGGRFAFKSPTKYDIIERKILDLKPEFVIAQDGERAFVHLPLGTDVELKTALLCAAIENQTWLCSLYEQLDLYLLGSEGSKTRLDKLKFRMPAAKSEAKFLSAIPHLNVIYQGSRSVPAIVGADGMKDSAPAGGGDGGDEDACNAGSGTLIENEFYMDTFVVKAYAPDPGTGTGS